LFSGTIEIHLHPDTTLLLQERIITAPLESRLYCVVFEWSFCHGPARQLEAERLQQAGAASPHHGACQEGRLMP
jgi:hypothetical protein